VGRYHARFRKLLGSSEAWSRFALGIPLYRYQLAVAEHLRTVAQQRDASMTVVEMPRQSGKNEVSAHIETLLLASFSKSGGALVKAAPTWTPQIVNSKMRLEARMMTIAERLPWLKYRGKEGYIILCGKAMIQFLSAKPNSSVVGATASILMEIDEAQDVLPDKYDKEFSPMRASTGAPVVFWGTTWSDETLLEQQKRAIAEGTARGRYFRVTPEMVTAENPSYADFLDGEVRRLGRQHPLIKTQYFLETLPSQGRMFSPQQLRQMIGEHSRQERRRDEQWIVAGLDFAGADEVLGLPGLEGVSGHDSVALAVAEVEEVNVAAGLTALRIRYLDRYEWTNVPPTSLHTALYEILNERWQVDALHCDATGVGEASTAFLAAAIARRAEGVVRAIKFDGAWATHSRLAFNFLMQVNGGLLHDYRPDDFDPLETAAEKDPPLHDASRHVWWQRGHARMTARPGKRVKVYVEDKEGHDDLLVADMLCVDAAIRLLGGEDALGVAGVG